MASSFTNKLKKVLLVILLYSLHFVALYAATSFIVSKSLLLRIVFLTSVASLCLSVIVGWLFVADDFREAFIRFKKSSASRDPSSEFTVFAPVRFIMGLLLWPYLAVFMNENREEAAVDEVVKMEEPVVGNES